MRCDCEKTPFLLSEFFVEAVKKIGTPRERILGTAIGATPHFTA
jgi:hypothetical protein